MAVAVDGDEPPTLQEALAQNLAWRTVRETLDDMEDTVVGPLLELAYSARSEKRSSVSANGAQSPHLVRAVAAVPIILPDAAQSPAVAAQSLAVAYAKAADSHAARMAHDSAVHDAHMAAMSACTEKLRAAAQRLSSSSSSQRSPTSPTSSTAFAGRQPVGSSRPATSDLQARERRRTSFAPWRPCRWFCRTRRRVRRLRTRRWPLRTVR